MTQRVSIYNLPTLSDEQSTRDWVRRILQFADLLSDVTSNAIDNHVVDWLQAIVENDDTWSPLYNVFLDVFEEGKDADEGMLRHSLGADPKIDPAIIMLIIELASKFFDWWRNK